MSLQDSEHLQGVAQLSRQLDALGKLDDGKALRQACAAGMRVAKKIWQATIPVGTEAHRLSATYGKLLVAPGYARSTIRVITTINAQKNIASAVMGVRKGAFYEPKFVEFGTRYQRPQPTLRAAFFSARGSAEDAFKESLQKSVDKAAKTT